MRSREDIALPLEGAARPPERAFPREDTARGDAARGDTAPRLEDAFLPSEGLCDLLARACEDSSPEKARGPLGSTESAGSAGSAREEEPIAHPPRAPKGSTGAPASGARGVKGVNARPPPTPEGPGGRSPARAGKKPREDVDRLSPAPGESEDRGSQTAARTARISTGSRLLSGNQFLSGNECDVPPGGAGGAAWKRERRRPQVSQASGERRGAGNGELPARAAERMVTETSVVITHALLGLDKGSRPQDRRGEVIANEPNGIL
ncbi:hypothetical protein GCM10022252_36160 [Streptosporangium oxazolinicum]|uniref:Uncharacterized protein n=1 Tax=Streptosporangium oxazolinicum TaxID=909287 RepID=A0ABP8AY30_9ACTN